MVKAKVFVQVKTFDGVPKHEDINLIEEELPPLKDGEFLAEAVFISVDPYFSFSDQIVAEQVAIITESKNPDFPVGKYVAGMFGWRTHTVVNGKDAPSMGIPTRLLPDFGKLPLSLALGPGGTSGNTAYFGFLEICKPKAGETVVVSAAAGAVGNVVGQIAKIKGCKVIGIAGSDAKLKWLKGDLGFDGVINYKTEDVEKKLKELAPQGVDCYFDNVGGEITAAVLNQMNMFGRVSICGVLVAYYDSTVKSPVIEFPILAKQLKVEGFQVDKWLDRWDEGIAQNLKWLKEGKLKYNETVTDGFENILEAVLDLLKGKNTGKAILKV